MFNKCACNVTETPNNIMSFYSFVIKKCKDRINKIIKIRFYYRKRK